MMNPRAGNVVPGLVLSVCFLAGCGSGGPAKLTLHPTGKEIAYAKTFSQAYAGKTIDGSYACVLVSDDAPAPAAQGDAPLVSAAAQPLRQIVYIKVLWRPMTGTRDSVASNAAIDWYVLGDTTDGSDDVLLYQGCGFVELNPDGDETSVTIRSSDLRASVVRGKLTDPIGEASVTGRFVALNDSARMSHFLSEAQQRCSMVASGR